MLAITAHWQPTIDYTSEKVETDVDWKLQEEQSTAIGKILVFILTISLFDLNFK